MRLKTVASVAILSLVPIGLTVAVTSLLTPQPACAQETLQECVQNLIKLGVSPDKAAETCQSQQQSGQGQQSSSGDSCMDKLMYQELRSTGSTPEGRWRYPMTYSIANAPEVTAECEKTAKLGTSENLNCRTQLINQRTRFISSSLRSAGCEDIGSYGWRCPKQTVQVQLISPSDAAAQCRGGVPNPVTTTPVTPTNNPAAIQKCTEQFMYREVRGLGPRPDGRWSYSLLVSAIDPAFFTMRNSQTLYSQGMERAGCKSERNARGGVEYACSRSTVRVQVMEASDATAKCTAGGK